MVSLLSPAVINPLLSRFWEPATVTNTVSHGISGRASDRQSWSTAYPNLTKAQQDGPDPASKSNRADAVPRCNADKNTSSFGPRRGRDQAAV